MANHKLKLSASNPDDEALICGAEYFGFHFLGRTETDVVIKRIVQPMVFLGSRHAQKNSHLHNLQTIKEGNTTSINSTHSSQEKSVNDGRNKENESSPNQNQPDEIQIEPEEHQSDYLVHFTLLNTIPFTSKRKRMSVIGYHKPNPSDTAMLSPQNIHNHNDMNIIIYTKGADTVILDRLSDENNNTLEKTKEQFQQFSAKVLRRKM